MRVVRHQANAVAVEYLAARRRCFDVIAGGAVRHALIFRAVDQLPVSQPRDKNSRRHQHKDRANRKRQLAAEFIFQKAGTPFFKVESGKFEIWNLVLWSGRKPPTFPYLFIFFVIRFISP